MEVGREGLMEREEREGKEEGGREEGEDIKEKSMYLLRHIAFKVKFMWVGG